MGGKPLRHAPYLERIGTEGGTVEGKDPREIGACIGSWLNFIIKCIVFCLLFRWIC